MRGNTIQIELPLKRGRVAKTIPLYQYDYGQKLLITGVELPESYEVHFSNEMHGDAVTSLGDSTGVLIPDTLLASGNPVYLWLYLHEDSTDGETEFQGVIPVIQRAKVTDQTPTPTEQSVITQAIAALNTALTGAQNAKTAAEAAQTHIENLSVSASSTSPEAGASVTKTVSSSGEVSLAFAIPRGDKGDPGEAGSQGEPGNDGTDGTDGFSPVVSMTKEDDTVTLSITDAVDTYTVEIKDGSPGDPSDLIDDEAGSGDTDVTWSANKLDNLTTTVGGKADKVSSATNGNFASLDSNGNLTDSGHKHSDYLTSHQDITGKADKVSSATNGNFAGLDSNGNLTDSGHKHSDYLTSHQDISGKSDITNLAPAFSSSSTYAVGDHVTYNGKYYVCSTAVSTAGSWDSSKWTEKTIGAESESLLTEINSKADVSDVTELGEKVDQKAGEPTGTKSAGKVYGLDSNLNPAWVEKDTDPSVIAEATSEWLDDHPEATTTVEDESITKKKLNGILANEIESKAPGITADTSKAFNHSGVTAPSKITFYGNANAFGNAKYANRKNVSPGNTKTQTKSDVVCTGTGCFINLNGTASGNNSFEHMDKALDAELPAGDYKVYVLIAPGESTISSYGTFDFYIRYSDEATNKNRVSKAIDGTENVYTFTASKAFNRIRYTFPITSGNVYSNAKVWIGLFKSDVSTVDCGQTVASDGTLAYNVTTSIGTNEVSTMLHESVLTDVIDTKTYIDNHIPENMITEDDLIYLTPEMYGAVGDGVTDDSSAFQDCLDAASLQGVPVKANGKYAIGTGLIITHGNTVDFTDVFFNSITFTGSGSAITVKGYCNRVTGNILSGYSNANATSMLKLEGVTNSTNGNNIDISVIFAYNDAVELDCTNGSINYNVFNSRNIVSRNGNCFYLHGEGSASIGENTFYCKMITCNNGYAIYVTNNGNYTNRFYNMRCEHQCANIVYGIASIIDARTVECMDQKESNLAKGNVFTIPSGHVGHMANSVGTFIDLEAFNVENADSYEDRIALLVSSYEGGATKAQAFNKAFYQCGNSFGSYVVGRCNRYICDEVSSIIEQGIYYILSPGKLISYYNKKGFVPDENIVRTVDSATYYPCKRAFPTDMVMGANSTIYLDDSYCCLGINKFTITQTEQYKAVVYDKNNNKIFDGTNLQPGVYQFTCKFVPLTSLTVTLSNEETLTYTGLEVAHLYTGSNEEWVIEKLNVIS